ncbi:MAG: suppressor of fused domain protein [Pirellula sp.]
MLKTIECVIVANSGQRRMQASWGPRFLMVKSPGRNRLIGSLSDRNSMGVNDDEWEEIDNARAVALSSVLGEIDEGVFHSPHPFSLGGNADVRAFHKHIAGVVYVTTELTGKPDACYADYELMICHRKDTNWGPNVISRLAPYTQTAYIGGGETMDIALSAPRNSTIVAFLFDTYDTFSLFGHRFELRLCIGITQLELDFKMKTDGPTLKALLQQYSVYPFTDLHRDSIPLPKIG